MFATLSGSSPLTRGKRTRRAPPHVGGRLIPAHAGKTTARAGLCGLRTAHPRSRGENNGKNAVLEIREGSSPLTRGKRGGLAGRSCGSGLIPAHAGKTTSSTRHQRRSRAHPRSRGENGVCVLQGPASQGSSPLTRGKRSVCAPGTGFPGLIPAHAGKTAGLRREDERHRAHPRSRGENL